MWGVLRFYNLLRIGVSWKGPEVIELWYNASDSSKGSTGRRQNDEIKMRRTHEIIINIENSDDDDDDDEVHITDDAEKSAASGSDEDDSLLVAYDSNSVASVWHKQNAISIEKLTSKRWTICLAVVIAAIELYAQIILLF